MSTDEIPTTCDTCGRTFRENEARIVLPFPEPRARCYEDPAALACCAPGFSKAYRAPLWPPPKVVDLGNAWPWPTVTDARKRGDPSWFESTEERWSYALGVLPPVYFAGGFMMGEEADHTPEGVPIYAAWVRVGERCFVREMPKPHAEAEARRLRDHLGATTP